MPSTDPLVILPPTAPNLLLASLQAPALVLGAANGLNPLVLAPSTTSALSLGAVQVAPLVVGPVIAPPPPAGTTRDVTVVLDGEGNVLTTGDKVWLVIHFPFIITGVTLLADVSGSLVVDILHSTYSAYPGGFTSICAAAKPTLSSAQKSTDGTLTGWTPAVSAGDVLKFHVDSASTLTSVELTLTIST